MAVRAGWVGEPSTVRNAFALEGVHQPISLEPQVRAGPRRVRRNRGFRSTRALQDTSSQLLRGGLHFYTHTDTNKYNTFPRPYEKATFEFARAYMVGTVAKALRLYGSEP